MVQELGGKASADTDDQLHKKKLYSPQTWTRCGCITIDKQTVLKRQTASELIYIANGTFPYSNSGTDKDHNLLLTKQI